MGKFSPLFFAGAVLAGLAGAAHAADLLPPPPALPAAPAVAPMSMGGDSGWYIRGDLGVAVSNTTTWTGPAATPPAGFATVLDGFNQEYLTGDAFADVGAGYQFNSWLRADVTAELHGSQSGNGVTTQLFNSTTTPCVVGGTTGSCQYYQDHFNGEVHTQALMLNAYADVGTWYGISPYVGAGVGIARHTTDGFLDNGANVAAGTGLTTGGGVTGGPSAVVLYNPVSAATNYSFAWALMAGLSFDVTQNLKMDIGYRYIDMGKAKTGADNCLCGVTYPGFAIAAHEHDVRVGLRWLLAGDYPPPPPPAPIVSRY
ncbi:MAG: porin family protein [Hyphomicrobiales bacterium]|nr:outer membrane beta-barrel protein [Hyphomicrobiales bacterium]MDE2017952.1 porin family protein [Hyphomicrobiales bacterium]